MDSKELQNIINQKAEKVEHQQETDYIHDTLKEIFRKIDAINESINSIGKKIIIHNGEIDALKRYNKNFLKVASIILAIVSIVINIAFRIIK